MRTEPFVIDVTVIYFWIYLRPPICSNSTPFGGPVSLLGGQAPPGVRVILTLDTPSPDLTPLGAFGASILRLRRSAFPFLFIYDSNTVHRPS